MTVGIQIDAIDGVMSERKRQHNVQSYFNDPVAWARDIAGVHLWSKQREISHSIVQNKSVAVKAGHGVGKAVGAFTPIPTPSGWKIAKDLRVGDVLFDEAGYLTNVIEVSPVWDREFYRITFDDDSTIEACAEHEWDVLNLSRRTAAMKRGVNDWREYWDSTVTMTTQELFDAGTTTNSGQRRWRIPLAKPLQLPEADLPIDPYLLGFWLGDGNTNNGQICIGNTKSGLLNWLTENDYKYSEKQVKDTYSLISVCGLSTKLNELGVRGNKHIPMQYLRASEQQRRELLAGIMDADGFLLKAQNGADVGIGLTHKQLADDVYDLLMTLGCKVRRSEGVAAYTLDGERHETGTRYRMNWVPLENPFKIRGEEWREPEGQRSRHTQRTIVSIEPIGRDQNFCIQVDSPRNLYLAGRSLIPTHNSFLVAVLVCWWVDTRYPHVFVASTAPSTAQISAIVWREIRRLKGNIEKRYKKGLVDHQLPGYITSDNQWKENAGGNLIGFGRKPPDNKEDDAFQGIHDGYVLAIGDEAVGLSEELIDALGNITSNKGSRRVLLANPTNPASYFAKIFKEDSGAWALHTISVLDSPNFTDEAKDMSKEALEKLTGHQYVEDKKKEYGEGSARYKSRVLGEFAFDSEFTLIKPEDLEPSIANDFPEPEALTDENGEGLGPVLGVDVARFGPDKSVVYRNDNGRIRLVEAWGQEPTTVTANRVNRIALDTNARVVFIDVGGLGGGVKDQLLQIYDNRYIIIEINSAATGPNRAQWHNFRAFMWDDFRRRSRAGEFDIESEDTDFHDELMSVQYKYNPTSGGLVIETKQEMKDRGMKSPDYADAAIYSTVRFDFNNPRSHLRKGDVITQSPDAILEQMPDYLTMMRTW